MSSIEWASELEVSGFVRDMFLGLPSCLYEVYTLHVWMGIAINSITGTCIFFCMSDIETDSGSSYQT